ncbi:T9SS type A sorting domain-containing protein [Neolewinella lacunae]|uniref:T9SS type A sorting domain-containing protein n=1 Tax=Neolewinella lacunae TaxID=1517758 RepID=A0A923PKM7_9BACT|nr:T9SS type A sorting domain-containing protein [Neolewinella lacunae]MBC6995888.1 T9SS type A sorting domain-containing protein [Neolewinella lacunae]MDN3636420.1 T9SS type A sorting domain-containing protein [Neolewinella lacunae]
MRYFFLLLLFLFLCTCARAQLTVTADVGLRAEYCNATVNDPNTDCTNVPPGNDMLTYLPGQDGEILITYRVTNNSGRDINQLSLVDTEYGVVLPLTTVTVPDRTSLAVNFIRPARTVPATKTNTITLNVRYVNGQLGSAMNTYTIEVVAPSLEIAAFGIGRTADSGACDGSSNTACFALDGTTSVTVGARDSISAYFRWRNNGLSTIDQVTFLDSNAPGTEGIQENPRTIDLAPNANTFGTDFFVAPDAPGTYTRTFTLTATDLAGNTSTVSVNYTLVVVAPSLEIIEFGIGRTADSGACDGSSNTACFALDGTTSVTVGARDSISAYFRWRNNGLSTIDQVTFLDSNAPGTEGIQENPRTIDLAPNANTFGTDFFVAPDAPGTYTRTFTLTATDLAGNTTTVSVNYTLIVTAPSLAIIEFGIGRTADSGACDGSSNTACFALNGTTSVTVGARDSISAYFRWRNVGLSTIDQVTFQDSNAPGTEGIQENPRTIDLAPNANTFGTDFFVAPDVPGTYTRTFTLTATDLAGNTTTVSVNYTLIVTAPSLAIIEFGIGRTDDSGACDGSSNTACFALDGTTSVTVGTRDSVSAYFRWRNIGSGIIDQITFQDSNAPGTEGIQENPRTIDLAPNANTFGTDFFVAPDAPGTYTRTFTLTATDLAGNTSTVSVNYTLMVSCAIGDFAPPTALCQNRTYTIVQGGNRTIAAGALDGGSSDQCGSIVGGLLSQNTFDCSDAGPNTVTLTVEDEAGNQASCNATVTIVVEEAVFAGNDGDCVFTTVPVSRGNTWYNLDFPSGELIAQVRIGNNTNVASVRARVFKGAATTESIGGQAYLGKRVVIQPLGVGGAPVQPNVEPVEVRLFYSGAEIAALLSASPGASLASLTLVKTNSNDCFGAYNPNGAVPMTASTTTFGCAEDRFFEFFTNTFSTFYLFANDAVLPVELTEFTARAIEKQRVLLEWTTAAETDNSHFVVERSADGVNFVELGAVAGAGQSQEEQGYEYLDIHPFTGVNYYRLRQVDFGGSTHLSEVRQVTIEGEVNVVLYPNPAVNELRLRGFPGGQLRILDAHGRQVLEKNHAAAEPLNVATLPPGVYFLQLPSQTLRWVKR